MLRVPEKTEQRNDVPAFQFGLTLGVTVMFMTLSAYMFGLRDQKPVS